MLLHASERQDRLSQLQIAGLQLRLLPLGIMVVVVPWLSLSLSAIKA